MQKSSKEGKKRSVKRTIYRVVILLLISLIAGSAVYSFNARHVLHDQMPMPLGIGVSYVLSPSMEPKLHVDDLVFVRSADSYSVGDIVIYQEANALIIHRIIQIDGDTLITKGDNNNTADAPIQVSSVKGKMVFSVPFIGALVRLLQTTLAKIVLILLAALLLKLSWKKEKKSDEEELDQIKAEIRKLKAEQFPEAEANSSGKAVDQTTSDQQSV